MKMAGVRTISDGGIATLMGRGHGSPLARPRALPSQRFIGRAGPPARQLFSDVLVGINFDSDMEEEGDES